MKIEEVEKLEATIESQDTKLRILEQTIRDREIAETVESSEIAKLNASLVEERHLNKTLAEEKAQFMARIEELKTLIERKANS